MINDVEVGMKVLVYADPKDKTASSILYLNGVNATVSKVKNFKNRRSEVYVELQGITSKAGIPFAFANEWLIECGA